jgi:hypothetical protein
VSGVFGLARPTEGRSVFAGWCGDCWDHQITHDAVTVDSRGLPSHLIGRPHFGVPVASQQKSLAGLDRTIISSRWCCWIAR